MTAGINIKAVSCSQTETAGHRCCCWAGQGDPGRTAARPDWSAQGEAKQQRQMQFHILS